MSDEEYMSGKIPNNMEKRISELERKQKETHFEALNQIAELKDFNERTINFENDLGKQLNELKERFETVSSITAGEMSKIENQIAELKERLGEYDQHFTDEIAELKEHKHIRLRNQVEANERNIIELKENILSETTDRQQLVEMLLERINELKEFTETLDGAQATNQIQITTLYENIAELKEDIKYIHEWQEEDCDVKEQLNELEEVLREFIKAVSSQCYIYEPEGKNEREKTYWLEGIKDQLLEKLEGKKGKTINIWCKECDNDYVIPEFWDGSECPHCGFWNKKDSEGTKEKTFDDGYIAASLQKDSEGTKQPIVHHNSTRVQIKEGFQTGDEKSVKSGSPEDFTKEIGCQSNPTDSKTPESKDIDWEDCEPYVDEIEPRENDER